MESHEQNKEASKTNHSNQKSRQHMGLLHIILTTVKPNVIQSKIRKILVPQLASTTPYLIQQHKKLES